MTDTTTTEAPRKRRALTETDVMAKIEDMLDGLPKGAQRRVCEWAHDKYILDPENQQLLARLDAADSSAEDAGFDGPSN